MAALPNDRYPAISEMVLALEAYLEESGIAHDKVPGELARYFQSPVSYELALKERLVDHLTRRGQKLLADGDQAPALDVFDRVLTIDPDNAKVIAILDGINRRQRLKTGLLVALGIFVIAGGGYLVHKRNQPAPPVPPMADLKFPSLRVETPVQERSRVEAPPPPPPIIGPQLADASQQVAVTVPHDAAELAPVDAADLGVPTQVRVSPWNGVHYRVGTDKTWLPVPDGGRIQLTLAQETRVYVEDTSGCCQPDDRLIKPGIGDSFEINALPGHIKPMCDHPNVYVNVENIAKGSQQPVISVPFDKALSRTKKVKVQFIGENIDTAWIDVTVEANKDVEVKCVAR
jgi:hypothetical protein